MKKWLGTICSALLGALIFVFLSIPQFVIKATEGIEMRETVNAWDMIKEDAGEIAGYGFYKFAAIALIVVACLLIVMAVILLLKNLNVLKLKFNLALVNNILLAVAFVLAVCALIALFVMGGDVIPDGVDGVFAGPSWGAWLNAAVALVAAAGGWVFARE